MASKADSEKQKFIQDKCQNILGNLLREEDNKYCVDCDAKGPRWASWNLGIFLCIRCAGIHRNLGVHISKVKSVNLDTWTPDQVACLQQMGNSQARAVYEANLPENFRRPQTDSSLETFIRAKYEHKKYIAKEWIPPPAPPPAFDIEEEKRKERERKKNKSKISSAMEISTMPQQATALPRPHSTGPSAATIQTAASKPLQKVPDSADLLSLGDSAVSAEADNVFDAFLSAPVTNENLSAHTPEIDEDVSQNNSTSEGDGFFKQKTVEDSNKSKMTKESILSLYASNTVQIPAAQHITPVYGVASGIYIGQQGYSQGNISPYQTVLTQGINALQTGSSIPAVYNPFASIGVSPIRQDAINQPNVLLGVSPGGVADTLLMAHGMGQVTQHMANLQISSQSAAWNMGVTASPVNSAGMVNGSNPTAAGIVWPPTSSQNNQNFSNNLWQ